jgi:hypothetical protein
MPSVYSLRRSLCPVKSRGSLIVPLLLGTAVLVTCGCSSQSPNVKGSVRLDGKPLADATLGFYKKGQKVATNFAETDAEGNFKVKPDKAKRTLAPGTYNVSIQKFEQKDSKPLSPAERDTLILAGKMHNTLPKRYDSPTATPLTAEIKPGDNVLPPFELQSK